MPPPWQRAAAAAPSIALLALFALVVLVGLTAAEIPCHYCGHQDLCPLPYIDRSRPESRRTYHSSTGWGAVKKTKSGTASHPRGCAAG